MRDLAVLVPSRERPHNIARLLDAMDATCRGDTTLVVGVDDDDPTLADYKAFSGCELVVMPGLQRQLVRWLNVLATARVDRYRFIGHIGDDNVPRTVGWDVRIAESLERNRFCFTDDLDPGRPAGSLALTIFMQSSVVRALDYFAAPAVQHMYADPIWHAWGTRTSMEFLSGVIVEHLHWSVVSAGVGMDESYKASTALIPVDCERYNAYCDDPKGLNADIAKLGGAPFGEQELREFNHRLNIPRHWGEPA